MSNPLKNLLADFHFVRGMRALRRGKIQGALAYFTRALGNQPNNAHYHEGMGVAFAMAGEMPQAVECFSKALALDVTFSSALQNRGLAYLQLGEVAHALADFDQQLALEPTNTAVYMSRGYANLVGGNLGAARADYNTVLESVNWELHDLARAQRAMVAAAEGDFSGALMDINTALGNQPDTAEFYAMRARIYRRMDQPENAVTDAEHALQIDAGCVSALLILAQHHMAQDDQQAESLLQKALDEDALFAEGFAALGAVYLQRGQVSEAQEEFEDALALMPALPIARLGMALCMEAQAQNGRAAFQSLRDAVPQVADGAWLRREHGWSDALLARVEAIKNLA